MFKKKIAKVEFDNYTFRKYKSWFMCIKLEWIKDKKFADNFKYIFFIGIKILSLYIMFKKCLSKREINSLSVELSVIQSILIYLR